MPVGRQIDQVFKAFLSNCKTTEDVANATGISLKQCSSYVSELVKRRLLRKIGNGSGRMHRYEPYYIRQLSSQSASSRIMSKADADRVFCIVNGVLID